MRDQLPGFQRKLESLGGLGPPLLVLRDPAGLVESFLDLDDVEVQEVLPMGFTPAAAPDLDAQRAIPR